MTTATKTKAGSNGQVNHAPPLFGKTGADILSTNYPPPVWIVPDYLPTGLGILSARPKTGKSFLALQITQAVAAGGKVLNQSVSPGRVLYFALEDNERRLQERMNKQKWTQKAANNTTFFTAYDFRQNIGALHRGGRVFLEAIIQNEGYKLIVIDTLSRAFIGLRDMNDSQEVTAALDPLQTMALENDVCLLFVDHQSKPKGNNPNPIDDVMNSTAKSAVADTLLGMYRNHQDKTVRFCGEGKAIAPFDITLKFDPITGCWQSEGDTDQFINNQNDNEIIDALITLKAASLTAICQLTGKDKGNTSKRITKLINRGMVERLGSGNSVIFRYIGTI